MNIYTDMLYLSRFARSGKATLSFAKLGPWDALRTLPQSFLAGASFCMLSIGDPYTIDRDRDQLSRAKRTPLSREISSPRIKVTEIGEYTFRTKSGGHLLHEYALGAGLGV